MSARARDEKKPSEILLGRKPQPPGHLFPPLAPGEKPVRAACTGTPDCAWCVSERERHLYEPCLGAPQCEEPDGENYPGPFGTVTVQTSAGRHDPSCPQAERKQSGAEATATKQQKASEVRTVTQPKADGS